MRPLTPEQIKTVHARFLPERPGPLVGSHVVLTGNGRIMADRYPDPRVLLAETAGNYELVGKTAVLSPDDLRPHIKGFVVGPAEAEALLKSAFPDLQVWRRVIYTQPNLPQPPSVTNAKIRRLTFAHAAQLATLPPEVAWVSKTWGGVAGLAASGYGWGAFMDGVLASVACTFFLGEQYEEIGVATHPTFQRLGLSSACTLAHCADIWSRGHQPSWTTSIDNAASQRVAEKAGFHHQRDALLYVVGIAIP